MKDIDKIAKSVQVRSGKKTQFTFYLTEEMVTAMKKIAEKHQISMSALMDQMVREVIEGGDR